MNGKAAGGTGDEDKMANHPRDDSMTMAEFRRLAGRHGGDVSAWPETRRAAAAGLARRRAEAAELLAEARVDAALAALAAEPPPLPEALARRMRADAAAAAGPMRSPAAALPETLPDTRRGRAAARPATRVAALSRRAARVAAPAAFAASAALGLLLGYAAPEIVVVPLYSASAFGADDAWLHTAFLSADLLPDLADLPETEAGR